MNILEKIQYSFAQFLQNQFGIDQETAYVCTPQINIDEQKQQFGDLNSNAPMVLARILKRSPRDIAQEIVQEFSHPYIASIDIAGPGFLNFKITPNTFTELGSDLFDNPFTFFIPSAEKQKRTISLEFVSANPTGPLHFGHGRGGIIGDVLANVLKFLGHKVNKEFYINDAGRQIQRLGESLKIRCQQQLGNDIPIPDDGYHGEYLMALAKECNEEFGRDVLNKPDSFFAEYAKEHLLADIKKTLHDYHIIFDTWFSEKTLHDSKAIEQAIKELEKHGYLYEKDGALWFKSTEFGDDKDRVVRKASGEYTYVAADIAYLKNKVERGHNHLIMILGHDHHSYATRLQGLLRALGLEKNPLDIILYQLVKIKEGGQQVRMSKRAGKSVTLDDIINTVGTDVARFFYLNRKADAQLEFDIDLALKRTEENPVYYIQYAYVRTGSILQKAEQHPELKDISVKDAKHLGKEEQFLLKKIVSLKELLQTIGDTHQVHLLAYYAHELAQAFAKYYAKNRVIDLENIERSRARLLLTHIIRNTLQTCLELMGLSKPEKM